MYYTYKYKHQCYQGTTWCQCSWSRATRLRRVKRWEDVVSFFFWWKDEKKLWKRRYFWVKSYEIVGLSRETHLLVYFAQSMLPGSLTPTTTSIQVQQIYCKLFFSQISVIVCIPLKYWSTNQHHWYWGQQTVDFPSG